MAADKERGPGTASAEIGKYLEILAKDPNSRVFAPLAEAYRKAGMLDDAIETALEGLKVHPNYLGGRVALGRAYFEKKQLVEAAAEMRKVVASAPDNLMAHKVLGQLAYAQNDLPSAEKSFKMVLLLDPRDQEAQQFIANIGGGTPPVPVKPAAPTAVPAPAPQQPHFVAAASMPVQEPQPLAPKSPVGTVTAPPLMEEIPIPGLPPPGLRAPEAVSFDELQPLEELDLAGADLLDDVTPPVQAAAAPPSIDADLDLSEPEPWAAPPAPPLPPPEHMAPRSGPAEAVPDEAMQVEVFSRVPWGTEQSPAPAPGAAAPALAAPEAPTGPEDSPFEVFGRPKRGGPPPSRKGENLAYQEIEIEHTLHAPVPDEAASGEEPVFEVFTRTPEPRTPPPPEKTGRGELSGPREIEIETTAFAPYESYEQEQPAGESGFEIERTAHTVNESEVRESAPEMMLEDELPRIDLAEEMTEDRPEPFREPPEEAPFEVVAPIGVEPLVDVEPSIGVEPLVDLQPRLEVEPAVEPEAPYAPAYDAGAEDTTDLAPAPWGDTLEEMSLDEEIPNIDLAREVAEEPFVSERAEPERLPSDRFEQDQVDEEFDEEPEPAQAEAAPGAARGVFDTETLASIYVSQGFYGRAADIYRRLIAQRPADEDLRARLEDVLARERGEAAAPAAAVPAAAPEAAPAAAPEDSRIRQLQTLLEAFRGGRP